MSVTKTRSLLVDVARRLFAQQGLEGTTMNDIAVASNRGRRTLYTYFKNKEEIYYAVVSKDMDPEQKLILMIYTHLNMIKEAVTRNGNLRAEFFRNIWMVERVRKAFDHEELELFRRVLQEGCDMGRFVIENVSLMADIFHYCIKGMEVPFIYGRLANGLKLDASRPIIANWVRRLLGMAVGNRRIDDILHSLGFVTVRQSESGASFSVPTWRDLDVMGPADLAEEVARIHGLDKLCAKNSPTSASTRSSATA